MVRSDLFSILVWSTVAIALSIVSLAAGCRGNGVTVEETATQPVDGEVLSSRPLPADASVPEVSRSGSRAAPVPTAQPQQESTPDGTPSVPEVSQRPDEVSDSAESSDGVEAPADVAAATRLWEERGEEALPSLAAFFRSTPLEGESLQATFDLLRTVAVAIAPGDADAPHVLSAIGGFLRLGETPQIRLPKEVFAPPWHVCLRLVVGLRRSEELGPLLVRVAREELAELEEGALPGDRLRNAIYSIGYLRYQDGFAVVADLMDRSARADVYAADAMAHLRSPLAVPYLRSMLARNDEPATLRIIAHALVVCGGEAVTGDLIELLAHEDERVRRWAVQPLLLLSTPRAIRALASVLDSDSRRLQRFVEGQLGRYARALSISADDFRKLVQDQPSQAAELMQPLSRRLEELTEGDRRLRRDELDRVLELWREAGTLYVEEFDWVRDRHVLAVVRPQDLPRLEAVRRSILSEYRKTCVNEAEVVQRMISAAQKKLGLLAGANAEPK